MNKVPFADLKAQYKSIKKEIDAAINNTLENTSFIMGNAVCNFEKEFASYCEAKNCIGASSGTSALLVALKAAGIKEGDEVITTPHTFIATAEAISELKAKVKFVDINEETYTIDPDKIKKMISKKTKAIIPVHLYGQPADLDPINEIAEKNNLIVIEDCAQSHGARYKGKRVPVSRIGCFSFYPGKNLGAYGDGGAVVTDDGEIAEKCRMITDHGRKKGDKYVHSILGSNYRLDALQAAVLSVKLSHLDEWIKKRRSNAGRYNDLLKDIVIVPREVEYSKHVYHLYVIRTEYRDRMQKFLNENGISTGIHYPLPLHLQPAYEGLGHKEGDFPITEKVCKEVLSLPMFPELTANQIEYVSKSIRGGLKNVL